MSPPPPSPILHSHPSPPSVRKPVNFFLSQSAFPHRQPTTRHPLHTIRETSSFPRSLRWPSARQPKSAGDFIRSTTASTLPLSEGARGSCQSGVSRIFPHYLAFHLPSNRIHRGAILACPRGGFGTCYPFPTYFLKFGTTRPLFKPFVFMHRFHHFPSYLAETVFPHAPCRIRMFPHHPRLCDNDCR